MAIRKCNSKPSAAVVAPPVNDGLPSRPLAIACRMRIGGTPRNALKVNAYARSSAPAMMPPSTNHFAGDFTAAIVAVRVATSSGLRTFVSSDDDDIGGRYGCAQLERLLIPG